MASLKPSRSISNYFNYESKTYPNRTMKRKARYFLTIFDSVYKFDKPYMLCNDGKLRDFVWFGTVKSALKIYRSEGWAIRKASELVRSGQVGSVVINYAYDGETISNRGEIIKPQSAI